MESSIYMDQKHESWAFSLMPIQDNGVDMETQCQSSVRMLQIFQVMKDKSKQHSPESAFWTGCPKVEVWLLNLEV